MTLQQWICRFRGHKWQVLCKKHEHNEWEGTGRSHHEYDGVCLRCGERLKTFGFGNWKQIF